MPSTGRVVINRPESSGGPVPRLKAKVTFPSYFQSMRYACQAN